VATAISCALPDDVVGVRLTVPPELLAAAAGKGAKARTVYIALDTSGSMSSSFAIAKDAVVALIQDLRQKARVQDVVVVFYSSSANSYFAAVRSSLHCSTLCLTKNICRRRVWIM